MQTGNGKEMNGTGSNKISHLNRWNAPGSEKQTGRHIGINRIFDPAQQIFQEKITADKEEPHR